MNGYPTRYSDKSGTEETVITNDGEVLRMNVRGVQFSGPNFDSFEPPENMPEDQLASFSLNHRDLCSCCIECQIPISVRAGGVSKTGTLFVQQVLGDPAPHGGLHLEELHITLECRCGKYSGTGTSGWFEDELLEIQTQLPDGAFMEMCINCLYSDYHPAGHGAFGCMMCFRNVKSEYLAVQSKQDFWSVVDHYERYVQETFHCDDFERRLVGTGYRG